VRSIKLMLKSYNESTRLKISPSKMAVNGRRKFTHSNRCYLI
jgi:hypothetical protein